MPCAAVVSVRHGTEQKQRLTLSENICELDMYVLLSALFSLLSARFSLSLSLSLPSILEILTRHGLSLTSRLTFTSR